MALSDIRKEIDKIDERLVDLLCDRMALSKMVAEEKAKTGTVVLDSARESQILAQVARLSGPELEDYLQQIYGSIFDASKAYQYQNMHKDTGFAAFLQGALAQSPAAFPKAATVACQGVPGSYSQLAAEKLFDTPLITFFNNFDSVFAAVDQGLCQYGVLPIENSSYGSVGPVYDLMKNHNFYIARAVRLKVNHQLLGKPGASLAHIHEIASHPQALGQCSTFIKGMGNIKITVCENTAMAAEMVARSQRRDLACIASPQCAELYNLSVICHEIQISDHNYTRFICISKNIQVYPGSNKISLMLSLPHKKASLYRLLAKFASLGLNLTKIESRPIPGSDFEYMFYLDIEGDLRNPKVIKMLSQLSSGPDQFSFFGNYLET